MFSLSFRGVEAAVLCIKPTEFGSKFQSNKTENFSGRNNEKNKMNDYSLFDEIRLTENRRTFFPYLLVKKKILDDFPNDYRTSDSIIPKSAKCREKHDMTGAFFPTTRIEVLLLERTFHTDSSNQNSEDISSCFDLENVLIGIKKCFERDNLITVSNREDEYKNIEKQNECKIDFFLTTTAMINRSTTHYILDDFRINTKSPDSEADSEKNRKVCSISKRRENKKMEAERTNTVPRRTVAGSLLGHIHPDSSNGCCTDAISSLDLSMSNLALAAAGLGVV